MLPQLPEEIFAHTFRQLCVTSDLIHQEDDRKRLTTLANVALTSKTFNRIVRQYLYRSLDLRPYGNRKRRLQILRALARTPENAHHVLELHLGSWSVDDGDDVLENSTSFLLPTKPASISPILAAIPSCDLSPGMEHQLQQRLSQALGSEDSEIALLLALCTNVRLLSFETEFKISDSLILEVFRNAQSQRSTSIARPLQNLREVNVEHEGLGVLSFAVFEDLFRLPNLETFRGLKLTCNHIAQFSSPSKSRVERIFLRNSSIDATGLRALFTTCPSLGALSIEWYGQTEGECCINIPAIAQVLRTYGSQLRCLRLNPTRAECVDRTHPSGQAIGSLAELTSLRIVTAQYTTLFGRVPDPENPPEYPLLTDILPTSLRTLRILDNTEDDPDILDEQLCDLMQDEKFENLKTIRVNRGALFSEDANEIGWDDSESNQYWVVLKRKQLSNEKKAVLSLTQRPDFSRTFQKTCE